MHDHEEPVTLYVSHLPASTSFYLSALQPLGYRFLQQVFDPSDNSSSSIGLGPKTGHRVDLYLAERDRQYGVSSKTANKRAHVVFPAANPNVVGDFYHCALSAGGRPVRAPDTLPRGDELYSATVTDLDGNKVEVCYSGPEPVTDGFRPSQDLAPLPVGNSQNRSIGTWAEDVASSTGSNRGRRTSIVSSKRTVSPINSDLHASASIHPSSPPSPPDSKMPITSSRSRGTSGSSHSEPSKVASLKSVDMSSKAVVGTLFGTATGAAIAYAVLTSQEDSRRREAEHNKKMQNRNKLESEARSNRDSQEARLRAKSNSTPRKHTDRDSGYYSSASWKEDSPTRWRATTYPQSQVRSIRSNDEQRSREAPTRRSSTFPIDSKYTGSTRSKKQSSRTLQPLRDIVEPKYEMYRSSRVEAPPAYRSQRGTYSTREGGLLRPEFDIPSSGNTVIGEDDDVSTVVPDDSISCAGSPPPRRGRRNLSGTKRRGGQGKREGGWRTVRVE